MDGGDRIEGPTVTIAMAKAEGWYGRSGSKWPTMPDLMLSYRSAAFFGTLIWLVLSAAHWSAQGGRAITYLVERMIESGHLRRESDPA